MDKSVAALLALLVMAGVGAAAVAVQFNNQGILLLGNFEVYVNNARLVNGTTLEWGANHPGNLTRALSVLNIDNRTVTLTLYVANLPSGWSEAWSANATSVESMHWLNGTLTLSIPAGVKGSFTFGNMVLAATV